MTVVAPGVLGNDTDADGDALTPVLVTGPAHGTLTLNADGSFTYTPTTGYHGPDSFTYAASDGTLQSSPVVVILQVTPAPITEVLPATGSSSGGILQVALGLLVAGASLGALVRRRRAIL